MPKGIRKSRIRRQNWPIPNFEKFQRFQLFGFDDLPFNVQFEIILSIFLISEIVHLKLWGKLESQENEWYWGHGFRLFNYFHIHPQKHKLALLQMESSIISKIVSTKTLKVHRAENEEFKEKPEIIGLIGLKELVAKKLFNSFVAVLDEHLSPKIPNSAFTLIPKNIVFFGIFGVHFKQTKANFPTIFGRL